jgi:hypothetical protein
VSDARVTLEKGEIRPVLKWLMPDHEAEARAAFQKTLVVRKQGGESRDLADRYFFETVVRLHRMGEGEPFTGLKPAGSDPGMAVRATDAALESKTVDEVVALVTREIEHGIRKRFQHAMEKKHHVGASVEAGREFVNAYVEFVHYVKRLYDQAAGSAHDTHHLSEAGCAEHRRVNEE